MDDEIQQPEPKITLVVGILGTIVAMIMDLLSLLPGAGDIEEVPAGIVWVLNFISGIGTPVLIVQGTVMLLKAIPVVQALPLWTPSWLFAWYMEAHPSALTARLEQAASIAAVAEGEGGEVGGAEGAIAESTEATAAEVGVATAEAGETGAAAAGGAEAGSAAEGGASENARPSEEKTERGSKEQVEEEQKQRRSRGDEEEEEEGEFPEIPQKTEEEEKEEASEERYEKLTTPEVMRNPVEVAKEKELGEQAVMAQASGGKDVAGAENDNSRQNEATRRLSGRFAQIQKRENERRQREAEERRQRESQQDNNQENNYIDEAAA